MNNLTINGNKIFQWFGAQIRGNKSKPKSRFGFRKWTKNKSPNLEIQIKF